MAGPIRISILADDKASRTFASVGASAGGMSARVGKYGRAMGLAVAGGAVLATAATVKWAKDSVTSLARIERINTQTAAVIKSTGGAAGVTGKHVEGLAGKLEKLTATEAESIQEGQNLLLTFTNIQNKAGKGNKVFDQTTKIMVDMARALGTEPQANAVQLGKALNDPIKGVTALSRVGVSFTDQQKKQIASFQESGNVMKAQKVILGELTKEFGGSGKAFAKTAEGQKAALGHAFGTLGETIFAPLLPWVTKTTTQLTAFITFLIANVGPALASVKGFIAPIVDGFRGLFDGVSSGNTQFSASMEGIKAAIAGLIERVLPVVAQIKAAIMGMVAVVLPILQQIVTAIMSGWAQIQPQVRAIWSSVQNVIVDALTIIQRVIQIATGVITAVWDKFGADILRYITTAMKNVATILKGAFQVIEGIFKAVSAALRGDWQGVWDGIKKIVEGALNIIKGIVSQAWNVIRTAASIAWDALKAVISKAWNAIVQEIKDQIGRAVDLVSALPGKIKAVLSGFGSILLDAGKAIMGGLLDGIEAGWGAVQDKLEWITDKIPDWKGPASKDRGLLRGVGRLIMQGLVKGFEDGQDGVRAALEKVTALIRERINLKDDEREKTREREVLAALRGQYDQLLATGKAHERINDALDRAKSRLKEIRQAAADYAREIRQAVVDSGDVTNFKPRDETQPLTAETILSGLNTQVNKTRLFQGFIEKLRSLGLNKTSLQDLLDKGVDGGFEAAQALANSSADTIGQINQKIKDLKNTGEVLGFTASDALFKSGIRAAEAIVNGLEKRAKRIDKIADRLADRFLLRVQHLLGGKVEEGKAKKERKSTAEKSNAAAYERAAEKAAATATARPSTATVNIKVVAPVGSSSADIGRELEGHLAAYFAAGGRQLALG